MGFDSHSLPNSFRKCIAPEERAQSVALQTHEEASEKHAVKAERAMHDTFEGWCRVCGYFVIHSRMDKRPTYREGTPDYGVVKAGKIVFVEFKVGSAKPSAEQMAVITELCAQGTPVLVSNDVGQAINWTKEQLEK